MKRLIGKTALAAALIVLTGAAAAQVTTWKEIKHPPLRQTKMPQPKRIALANGMVILLQEDHELPLIKGVVTIRGGGRDIPADKSGLATIYGEVWRTGGTQSQTGDDLDDTLSRRAAVIETSADDDSASLFFDVLKSDFDRVLPVVAELIRKPALREDKIELVKGQMNTMISRRNDSAELIAKREATRLVYGTDSPRTRMPEYATVASITRDDLVAFHKRFAHPNNMIVGVVGDFDTAAMESKLRAAFGSWPRGPQATAPAIELRPAHPGVYLIDKADVTQSLIYLVHPGTTRDNPDYTALTVLNEVYGGGFAGRLLNRLRTEKGLAYSAGGGVGSEWDHPGVFTSTMGTKSETTHEALGALRQEMVDMINRPATAEELALAKDAILNSFVFRNDSPRNLLEQRILLEFHGYPADFYDKYRANVEKITIADVTRVARQYMKPDQLAMLVVGKSKDFEKPLDSYGAVKLVDITIPEPGGPKAPAAAASDPVGKAAIAKLAAFMGGPQLFETLRATRMAAKVEANTPQGPMVIETVTTTVYPSQQRVEMTLPTGQQMTMVVTPDAAFMQTPMGTQDLPGSQRDAALAELKSDLANLLRNAAGSTFTATGSEKIGNVDAAIVTVHAAGETFKLWIDPASGQLLRKSSEARAAGQTQVSVTDYADWKAFGAMRFPAKITTTVNGQPASTVTVSKIDLNPAVDAAQFRKP